MADDFPTVVKEFIEKHIHSVAQLELLLLLRSEPERAWTREQITSALYLQPQMVKELLADIVQRGFAVESELHFRYQPASDVDRQVIDRLAKVYHERRVAVTAEIFSKPTDVLKAFANAFRLRKEEE